MRDPEAIIGSPGTGKTYALEGIIRQYDDNFIYLTYNKSMAAQARERINNDKNKVGTFHSILSRQMHLGNFMKPKDSQEFCRKEGLTYAPVAINNGEEAETDYGKFMAWYDTMTNKMIKPANKAGDKLNFTYLLDKYVNFKSRRELFDYTDILRLALEHDFRFTPLLVVDEAQDLTPIMWKIIDNWNADRKVIAGDDEQCIYGFRAVDVNLFIEHVKNPTILSTSKRFGEEIRQVADNIIMPARVIKRTWHGTGESSIGVEKPKEFLKREGSKAILARTNSLAVEIAERLDVPAIVINPEHSLSNGWTKKTFEFVSIFHRYPNWTDADFKKVIENTPAEVWQRGTKSKAKRSNPTKNFSLFSFDLLKNPKDVSGLIDLLQLNPKQKRNVIKYYKNPVKPIYIDTIHASKGLEFDNVLLATDYPAKTEFNNDERRVLFTGVTRAKKRLSYYYFEKYRAQYEMWRFVN